MEAPFLRGVPYLSRQEEATVRRIRQQKANLVDIEIRENDADSIKLIASVRDGIAAWRSGRAVSQLA